MKFLKTYERLSDQLLSRAYTKFRSIGHTDRAKNISDYRDLIKCKSDSELYGDIEYTIGVYDGVSLKNKYNVRTQKTEKVANVDERVKVLAKLKYVEVLSDVFNDYIDEFIKDESQNTLYISILVGFVYDIDRLDDANVRKEICTHSDSVGKLDFNNQY